MKKLMLVGLILGGFVVSSSVAEAQPGQDDPPATQDEPPASREVQRITRPEDATPLLLATDPAKMRRGARKMGLEYESVASLQKALGFCDEEFVSWLAAVHRDEIRKEDMPPGVQTAYENYLRAIEFELTSPPDQVRKFFDAVHLAEKALIESHNGTFDSSHYTRTERNNIRHALRMFKDSSIFMGLPYEETASSALGRLFPAQ